ncbi:hypothetical protein ADK54_21510 [Streptomyces sp. WM6378]|nr:hypothetical protein ADK54_21510 [Streptomyces sp. WM6378]
MPWPRSWACRWAVTTMARRMSTERVIIPVGMAVACLFQAREALGFFRSWKTSTASAERRAW